MPTYSICNCGVSAFELDIFTPLVSTFERRYDIKHFEMCDPIAVWTNGNGELEIVEGHGRLLALESLGIDVAPIIKLDHLTDEERRAYTHIHNQTTLVSGFDQEILNIDLEELDFDWEEFGFDIIEDGEHEPRKGTSSGEIDLDDFSDDKFEHKCPRCGFLFNDGGDGND